MDILNKIIEVASCVFHKVVMILIFITNFLFERISLFVSNLKINSEFLQDLIGIQGILIGVAIPISFQVVLSIVKEYDREIAQIFTDEFLYKIQYALFFGNLILAVTFRLLKVENTFLLIGIFIWFIINIIYFLKFIKLVHEYVTDTDKVLLKKVWKDVKEAIE